MLAGLQRKQAEGKVVFGSVQLVARNLDRFDSTFSLVIVDECYRISDNDESQYQQLFTHLRQHNPQLHLLGLTATPFRLGKGWIYQYHYQGMVRGDDKAAIPRLHLRAATALYDQTRLSGPPPERLDMPVVAVRLVSAETAVKDRDRLIQQFKA